MELLTIQYLTASLFLLAASHVDMKSYRIPNLLNLSLLIAGALIHYQNISCFKESCFLQGLMWGTAFGMGMYFVGVFGAGDAKLFIALGGLIGSQEILATFIVSLFFMIIWSLPARLIKWGPKKVWEQEKQGLMFLILKIKIQHPNVEKLDVTRAPLAPFVLYGYLAVQLGIIFYPHLFLIY